MGYFDWQRSVALPLGVMTRWEIVEYSPVWTRKHGWLKTTCAGTSPDGTVPRHDTVSLPEADREETQLVVVKS
jgi:hypothetical protein